MIKQIDYEALGLDPGVIPMVEYFNESGLKTYMSCQGHNDTNMSMFWISFDESVTEDDILKFMKKHLDVLGSFFSNGRFAKRLIGSYSMKSLEYGKRSSWCYFAATQEAADDDLRRWKYSEPGFVGVNGREFQTCRSRMKQLGKI